MDIETELDSNQTVLLVMSSAEYNEVIVDVASKLSGSVCYVTVNKTYDALKEIFEKKKVDIKDIVFIDTISKTMKKVPDQGENVYYVSSPGALTEISLVIEKFLRHDFDYLVFDSITNLAVYQDKKICAKFLSDLVNKVKKTKTKSIFYALDSVEQAWVVDHTGALVDKVVKMSATGKPVVPVKAKAPVKVVEK